MRAVEFKTRMERGERLKGNVVLYFEINRLNGHAPLSAFCKAVGCVLFGMKAYYLPRKWQRVI